VINANREMDTRNPTVTERANERRAEWLFIRIPFWLFGTLLAIVQSWSYGYNASADSISYLDMSDAVLPGVPWHQMITGVWSPLYPFVLGIGRLLPT
jgi:hypothetical protein